MGRRDREFSEHSLKIRGLRGGTIFEITEFLNDMDRAYKALYLFDLSLHRRYLPRSLWLDELYRVGVTDAEFLVYGPNAILPKNRLQLNRISIQSPGFWEFLGSLNPLQQLREYLKDRHERKKDHDYRSAAEKERLILENDFIQKQILEKETGILREQLDILREAGFSEIEIRQMIWARVGAPLSRVGQHQDRGLIEGPEN